MSGAIITLDKGANQSLQFQIRKKFVDGILSGEIPANLRLPSTRKLSEALGVSRNTVMLSYQQLVDEGFLVTRERSGFFVNEDVVRGGVADHRLDANRRPPASEEQGAANLADLAPAMPYPFIDGAVDPELVPLAAWREAHRLALSKSDMSDWARLGTGVQDARLVEEIRSKVLVRRAILTVPEAVLIVGGLRAGLALLARKALARRLRVGLVEPSEPIIRQSFMAAGLKVERLFLDPRTGLINELRGVDVVCLSLAPNLRLDQPADAECRQTIADQTAAAGVTIWEVERVDSYPSDRGAPIPLCNMAADDSGIWAAALNPTILGGQPLAVVVGPRKSIRSLRQVAELTGAIPAPYTQRATSIFFSLGHYDAGLRRLAATYDRRRHETSEALSHYLPQCHVHRTPGSTSFWVEGPQGLDENLLARRAAKRGILIEPSRAFFSHRTRHAPRSFRLSFTAVPEREIEKGIAALADCLRSQMTGRIEKLNDGLGDLLSAGDIPQALGRVSFLGTNPLGERYEVTLEKGGRMMGIANKGLENEETDVGTWWTEGDFWCRRWETWSYGRTAKFRVVIDGRLIKWFRKDGTLIDSAVILSRVPQSATGPEQ